MSSLKKINKFLTDNSGVAGKLYDNVLENHWEKAGFFKPYKSTTNALQRAATIVTAPVLLLVISTEMMLFSVLYAFQALAHVSLGDLQSAQASGVESIGSLFYMTLGVAMAITSPAVNTIDFIGGGVTSVWSMPDDNMNEGLKRSS